MLKFILGCKSIERILFYLLVNEKCYAHQIHRFLHIPLTPVQKALARLEEGNVVVSSIEGKTRIFKFNPHFPLLNELEILLKKAFHLLPPNEKKQYYYLKPSKSQQSRQDHELLELIWNQLLTVTGVTLLAKSNSKSSVQWHRKGKGRVIVKQDSNSLIFNEQGSWQGEAEQLHNYSNSFRWTLNRWDKLIGLEHLRHGENRPVFLFHLVPIKAGQLESLNPHLCGKIPILAGYSIILYSFNLTLKR